MTKERCKYNQNCPVAQLRSGQAFKGYAGRSEARVGPAGVKPLRGVGVADFLLSYPQIYLLFFINLFINLVFKPSTALYTKGL